MKIIDRSDEQMPWTELPDFSLFKIYEEIREDDGTSKMSWEYYIKLSDYTVYDIRCKTKADLSQDLKAVPLYGELVIRNPKTYINKPELFTRYGSPYLAVKDVRNIYNESIYFDNLETGDFYEVIGNDQDEDPEDAPVCEGIFLKIGNHTSEEYDVEETALKLSGGLYSVEDTNLRGRKIDVDLVLYPYKPGE